LPKTTTRSAQGANPATSGTLSSASTAKTAPASRARVGPNVAKVARKPSAGHAANAAAASPEASAWYQNPIAWVIAALAVVVLVLLGLRRRRNAPPPKEEGPSLADQFGDSPLPEGAGEERGYEDSLRAQIGQDPHNLDLHLELCRLYYAHNDVAAFEVAAEAMHAEIDNPRGPEWREVVAMGAEMAPDSPLFREARADAVAGISAGDAAAPAGAAVPDTSGDVVGDPERVAADKWLSYYQQPENLRSQATVAESGSPSLHPGTAAEPESRPASEHDYGDDAVDTKLDLARAYLDMGDPIGARAMLEEVIEEGTRAQQDEAQRLLAEMG
jgi:pilus assembly protein FimV